MPSPINNNINSNINANNPTNNKTIQTSYVGVFANSVVVLLQTIPSALNSISCFGWAFSRMSINTTTGIVFGVTPLDVHTFSSRGIQSSKKIFLCAFAGFFAPLIGLASTRLGYRLLELPKSVPDFIPKENPIKAEKKPVTPTRVNMLSKAVFSAAISPIIIAEAGANAFWTLTRSTVNVITFVAVGEGLLEATEAAAKSAKLLTKAGLAILTCPGTMLLALFSAEASQKFYKKIGPGCIRITNLNQPAPAQEKKDNKNSTSSDIPSPQSDIPSSKTDKKEPTQDATNKKSEPDSKDTTPPQPNNNPPGGPNVDNSHKSSNNDKKQEPAENPNPNIPDAPPPDAPPMDDVETPGENVPPPPPPPPPPDFTSIFGKNKDGFLKGNANKNQPKKDDSKTFDFGKLGDDLKNFKFKNKINQNKPVSQKPPQNPTNPLVNGIKSFDKKSLRKIAPSNQIKNKTMNGALSALNGARVRVADALAARLGNPDRLRTEPNDDADWS